MKKITLCLMCITYAFSFSQSIDLEVFATGFTDPVNVKHADDDRLFVVEQGGVIKILNSDGTTNSAPFLDIDPRVGSGGERGLLAMAFHPNYAVNGFFYVNYTNNSGDTVISRFTRTNANTANSGSEVILMTISQPYPNHNGGDLNFGPNDGYLYISTGDGGSGGDPGNRAQSLTSLLGKMLRIDVDGTDSGNYGIPSDNPFVSNSAALDEIWSLGLRNPFRFSFDRANGDIWIGDVGQNTREEVSTSPASSTGGENYGWKCFEGTTTFSNVSGCSTITHTGPIGEYPTGGSPYKCSVMGGYVYRGAQSSLQGLYFFADYCSDDIGIIRETAPDVYNLTLEERFPGEGFSGFGEDINGEVYTIGLDSGSISRIVDSSLSIDEENFKSVRMFPNPAVEVLNFDITGTSIQVASISFYNILGKSIKTVSGFTNQNISISTKDMARGIYLVKIIDIDGNKDTRKLVVN